MTLATISEPIAFGPRQLSRSELIRLDVYTFESPKLGRRVTVVRPTALALALDQEFNPNQRAYVERPRTLNVDTSEVELSFWSATQKGHEQFLLLTKPFEGSPGAVRSAERRLETIQAAARRAQIDLCLVPEVSLLRKAVENANRLRLLPWVQTARTLPQAIEIEGRLQELFRFQPRHAISQLERNLTAFDARDVRAVICQQVHAGRLKLDLSTRLNAHSMVEVGGAT